MINFLRRIKSLSPREGYDLWARSYHAEANPIKKMSDDFIAENIPALKDKSVLDAGCGTGKLCTLAVQKGAAVVKGIDLSPAMIAEAKKNCPAASFECADLSVAPIGTQGFDVVICGLVLGHIENHRPVIAKMLDALKPGGTLIITDFHPEQTRLKAKRTFRDTSSGKTFEIKHTGHPIDEYFSILKDQITISVFKEPSYANKPVIFGISGIRS